MRGASAESLARLTDALGAAVSGGADANRMADDLFGVAGLLGREPGLRRVLTDLSIVPEAKSDLVRSMLAGKLEPASLDLVAQAAGYRWAATRHLADALEQLGVIAVVKGAEQAGEAEDFQDQLFGIGRLVAQTPELRDALADPARTREDKRALMHDVLGGKVTSGVLRLVDQALAGTFRTFGLAIEAFQKITADNRNRLVATVRSARALADDDRQRLKAALNAQYDKPVYLNVVVDPGLLGGLRIEIGDDVIDGTVVARLDDAGRRLAG